MMSKTLQLRNNHIYQYVCMKTCRLYTSRPVRSFHVKFSGTRSIALHSPFSLRPPFFLISPIWPTWIQRSDKSRSTLSKLCVRTSRDTFKRNILIISNRAALTSWSHQDGLVEKGLPSVHRARKPHAPPSREREASRPQISKQSLWEV